MIGMLSTIIILVGLVQVEAQTRITRGDYYSVVDTSSCVKGAFCEFRVFCSSGDKPNNGGFTVAPRMAGNIDLFTMSNGEDFDPRGNSRDAWFVKIRNTGIADIDVTTRVVCLNMTAP